MKFLDLLTRFVVVLPPVEDDELVRYIVEMGEEFDLGDALLDAPVLDTLLFLPSVGGKPLFITGKKKQRNYYQEALRVAVHAIREQVPVHK